MVGASWRTLALARSILPAILRLSPLSPVPEDNKMDSQHKERWIELAEAASKEQDPEKLLKIVEELNRALDEHHEQLRRRQAQHFIAFPGQASYC